MIPSFTHSVSYSLNIPSIAPPDTSLTPYSQPTAAHDKARIRFFEEVYDAVKRHVNFEVVKVHQTRWVHHYT